MHELIGLGQVLWRDVMFWGFKLTISLLILFWLVEIVWLLARWVLDAKKEWPHINEGKFFYQYRMLWCGSPKEYIPGDWLGSNTDNTDIAEYFVYTALYAVLLAVISAVWPIVIVLTITIGILYAVRGGFRIKRLLWAAIKELKNKAEKDHDHDERYQQS